MSSVERAPATKSTITCSRSSAAPSSFGPTYASILPPAKLATATSCAVGRTGSTRGVRQSEAEPRAAALAALEPDAAALRLDERTGDREPEAGALAGSRRARTVAAPEPVEDASLRPGRHAVAGVLDGDLDLVGMVGGGDGDRAVGGRMAERVREQVVEDPLDVGAVAGRLDAGRQPPLERDV